MYRKGNNKSNHANYRRKYATTFYIHVCYSCVFKIPTWFALTRVYPFWAAVAVFLVLILVALACLVDQVDRYFGQTNRPLVSSDPSVILTRLGPNHDVAKMLKTYFHTKTTFSTLLILACCATLHTETTNTNL